VLADQTAAIDPDRLDKSVGHLGLEEIVDGALQIVLTSNTPARGSSAKLLVYKGIGG
jgi:hypothetical protein